MARSSKKGPYVDPQLIKKVRAQEASGKKQPIKTWARDCDISPEMVGYTFLVHNGKDFKDVFISENMVGCKLGEFSLTRKFIAHSKKGFEKPADEAAAVKV